MKTAAKIATGLSALVAAGLVAFAVALAFASSEQPVADPAAAPMHTPTPGATAKPVRELTGYQYLGHGTAIPKGTEPGQCETSAYIWIGSEGDEPIHPEQLGADLVDRGPREFALGTVGLDEQGRPATYTVTPGDVLGVIGERFCIYNGMMLGDLNGYSHGAVIQSGDVLTLNAALVTDWVDPYADE